MSKSKTPIKKVDSQSPSSKKTTVESRPAVTSNNNAPATLPFVRMNYILLIAGVVVIALGFYLMSLDNFVDATQFSISLHIAPVVVVAGFAGIIYAIMYKPSAQNGQAASE
ncbi:MAG: DUF3098 domain-containing protein [Bacteroidia bacterium]|nr:DUF3098 domain-containing protein [Bacteroidia bacterium]